MKEPTYSVFVRFRRRQRLTLKRSAPLDIAVQFAATVRGERFHRPEDVFVVDDTTGETVSELMAPPPARAEALLEVAVAASPQALSAGLRHEVQASSSFSERWQLHHAQVTVRGGQRLAAAVERSLAQLTRTTELLRSSHTLIGEAEQVAAHASSALEHVRYAQEALQRAEAKLAAAPPDNEVTASLKALAAASIGEGQPMLQKRPSRAKG